ncbi:hypothetical protein [Streptomyces sp. CB03911]|uniref:hypothetical protein n=1 Tax=Streptomyces sp. CB03911 TaxID=1804758 RepID=UPI00093E3035|nr:hypothetical protein [Streptomyces sp. CB03911]OKI19297.1 hypothetical protein A6A07_07285 [Streptomyces sp. CB03911]
MSDKSGSEILGENLGNLASFFIRSWLVMLFVGILHGEYGQVPAVGYGTALILVALAGWATYQPEQR